MASVERIFNGASPPFVIAEVAQSHDGSLGQAHAFIDVAARSKADAIKFQTHLADEESSPLEPWRVRFSQQDSSRYEYWKRMEFSVEAWEGLYRHAADAGLVFLSSPFSLAAVQLLDRLGMQAWKVASGEVTNPFLMEAILDTKKPVLLSSGMSSWAELDASVATIRSARSRLCVLQCTTAYPCPPERVGLNVVPAIAERYGCPAGLSDHSGTIFPGLAAVSLGARAIEVHLTLSRDMFGPDVPASLTPDELASLTRGAEFIWNSLTHPIDKDALSSEFTSLRSTFGRSLVASRDLEAGHSITREDLMDRKPGTGIPVAEYRAWLGRPLKRSVRRGEFLKPDDFE